MAPLFGRDDQMKEVAKDMQSLSEQIAALKKQLAERNTQIEQLQQDLASARSQSSSQAGAAANKLQESQTQLQALQKQLTELQARVQQPSAPVQPIGSSSQPTPAPSQPPASELALSVGGSAWVTQAGGLPLRLRSQPGLAKNTIIDRLPPGTQMTLLEGPQSRDNHMWWRIRTTDGREGWVAGEDLRTRPD